MPSTSETLLNNDVSSSISLQTVSSTQQKILALLPIVPAILSTLGSWMILRLVYKGKFKGPYKRILFGLIDFGWAIGNDATCTLGGFFLHYGTAGVIVYSCCLSFFYLLRIRFHMSENTLATKVEKWMHFLGIGFPLATAFAIWMKGAYGEVEGLLLCYISDSYLDDAPLLGWITMGIPTGILLLCLLVNNVVIYRHVRRTTRKSLKRRSSLDSAEKRIRAVATQAALYVGAYLITFIWSIVIRLTWIYNEELTVGPSYFPFRVLAQTFWPMLGFFNAFVYIRPRYIRLREKYPEMTRRQALRIVLISRRGTTSSREGGDVRAKRKVRAMNAKRSDEGESNDGSLTDPFPSAERTTRPIGADKGLDEKYKGNAASSNHRLEDAEDGGNASIGIQYFRSRVYSFPSGFLVTEDSTLERNMAETVPDLEALGGLVNETDRTELYHEVDSLSKQEENRNTLGLASDLEKQTLAELERGQ